jgi:hypothetical protein
LRQSSSHSHLVQSWQCMFLKGRGNFTICKI